MSEKLAAFHLEWCMGVRTFDELNHFILVEDLAFIRTLSGFTSEEKEIVRFLLNTWWMLLQRGTDLVLRERVITRVMGPRYALACVAWAYSAYKEFVRLRDAIAANEPMYGSWKETYDRFIGYGSWNESYDRFIGYGSSNVQHWEHEKVSEAISWAYPVHPVFLREQGHGD